VFLQLVALVPLCLTLLHLAHFTGLENLVIVPVSMNKLSFTARGRFRPGVKKLSAAATNAMVDIDCNCWMNCDSHISFVLRLPGRGVLGLFFAVDPAGGHPRHQTTHELLAIGGMGETT
jgi:hypothetical protein